MEQGGKLEKEKKKLGCIWKGLLGLLGIVGVGFVGFNVWLNLNRDKIVDSIIEDRKSVV